MTVVQGINPRTGQAAGDPVEAVTPEELDAICRAAAAAAPVLAAMPPADRAAALRSVAWALRDAEPQIVAAADAETALGTTRLAGELVRTCVQLEMFADVITEGSVFEAVIDHPDPDAKPAPRPDVRRVLVPLGPVGVFSASNFPLAFSVAGGDTASALAAGCPVIVKAHSAHPRLSVLCGQLVTGALAAAGAPSGVFAVIHGTDNGRALVRHPLVTAVGFTGSLHGGRALFDLAVSRPDPIPFYGELGSLNPVVVTSGAVAANGADVVRGFVASYTLGAGQFCTKPGLLFLPAGHGLDDALAAAVREVTVGPLLTGRIRSAYDETAAHLAGVPGVRPLISPSTLDSPGHVVAPTLLAVSAKDLVARAGELLQECFGPAALVIEYDGTDDLFAGLDAVPGSLTAGLHAVPDDWPVATALVERLARRAGRIIYGGWPTGVAVTWAMHHGGPWPATTNPLHTSVGVTAIRRWQRPVAYQDVPEPLLPHELRDGNPLGIPRRVNGRMER